VSVLEIRRSRENDPDGNQMRKLLHAIAQVDRFAALHALAVHALAGIGIVLWIGVAFPVVMPDGLRRYALAAFAAIAVAAAAVIVLERRWQRVQRRCMRENDVRVLGDD
jgi:membrane protein implicated in regulation of membrane protease activity